MGAIDPALAEIGSSKLPWLCSARFRDELIILYVA